MKTNLSIVPITFSVPKSIAFGSENKNDSYQKRIPKPIVRTPKKDHPVALDDVSFFVANKIAMDANKMGISRTEYLMQKILSRLKCSSFKIQK